LPFGEPPSERHSGPGDPGTKHFFLADQLGSTSTVLSATGRED
jgi:hypothetical protein